MRKVRSIDGTDRSPDHIAPMCGRNDCSRPASARLMLDMANRVVSIDMEVDEVGAGMLCYNHAERVVVPRGWTLQDNRVIEPYLFDGSPYDIDDDSLDEDDSAGDADNVGGARASSPRKERPRRKLIQPTPVDRRDGVVTTGDDGAAESDGQLSMGSGYDLPTEYSVAADEPRPKPSTKRELSAAVDEIEADKSTSPLLARAFDMTKTRGNNPKVKRPPQT
jgi:hypothetical protein